MTRRPVKTLSPEVARKIAAGEVIDRPNAIVRELMDNAVDSGADSISVELSGGGIEKIRISDNGQGMTKEDLQSCARPHATSKIVEAADLLKLSTLGFRGEALSSIAAVSRLSISSGNWRMKASLTEDHILEEIPAVQNGKGTIVMSEGLFENYPARRMFLKRPASENLMCRETFVEKSLPRTDISFRLTIDGELRLDLPKDVSLSQRFVSATELKESPDRFAELKSSGGSEWSFKLVIGESEIYRNDRKQIHIFVNGRKVNEYSLIQAIEYGCQGFFPNGTHPVAALFVTMDPSLVDFNIHPAKREVRFKDSSSLHHGVSSTVKDYFRASGIKDARHYEEQDQNLNIPGFDFSFDDAKPSLSIISETGKTDFSTEDINDKTRNFSGNSVNFDSLKPAGSSFSSGFSYKKNADYSSGLTHSSSDLRSKFFNYESSPAKQEITSTLAEQALSSEISETSESNSAENQSQFAPEPQFSTKDKDGFCFIGSTMDCFLIAQLNDTVYFIDQHAAHERILFNKILKDGGEKQNLLIPYVIQTETEDEEKYLAKSLPLLLGAGFTGTNSGNGKFEFSTVPARWKGTEGDLRSALLDKMVKPEDLLYSVAAMTACKAAVKDGYILDRGAAEALAREALTLTDPHCPHGRPVWTTLTKEQLFARVRRTR